jgi:hypothetical protein
MSSLIVAAGARLDAQGTRDAFGALSDDLVAAGYPPMTVNFGDRSMTEEVTLFTTRYRQQATGSGAFGDVRTWDGSAYGFPGGTRWVRVSADGTVAIPGSSNHGRKRSGDLGAPYNADTPAHRAAEQLAKAHNITCEGMGFREWWHWTFWGPLGVIGAPAATTAEPFTVPEEDDMKAIRQAGVADSGIIIQAGVPPYSLVDQVFDALAGAYGLTVVELADWQYETVKREQWTAFQTAQKFAAGQSGDVQAIVAGVRDGLKDLFPKSFTVTPS